MNKVGIFFGSTTGNTEAIAEMIKEKLGADNVDTFNVESASIDEVKNYSNVIFGTSTWGLGDLQDDFQDFIGQLEGADLSGKVVALYGLGDGSAYAETFVDGIGEIYEAIDGNGCTIVGSVSKDGYDFDDSKALVDDEFVGLPLDEDNESDQHDARVEAWINSIKPHFN
jgi:flavodoxin I